MTQAQSASDPALVRNVRTMMRRYAAHYESGNHILRAGSQEEIAHSTISYFGETDPTTGSIHTNGYYVAPGGLGKSAIGGDLFVGINTMPNGRYVLGDPALGKRVLVGVATNQLADQWGDSLLGRFNEETEMREPSIFGDRFTEDNVGIYHADMSKKDKAEALSKAIVIAVHDSTDALYHHFDLSAGTHTPLINPEDFDLVLLDEVDDKVRGDVTRELYTKNFFPNAMIVGCTATHLFRSGRTVGDYIFGGKEPICEILHEDAVQKRELAPHVNIIVEPKVSISSEVTSSAKGWNDYSDAEKLRFIEQAGTDQALSEVIKVGRHPRTGKPLKDMMKLHQAVNIEHGKEIARQLNEKFGNNYAQAVWGGTDEEMDDEMRRIVRWAFDRGDLKSVVQCKLWGRGTDIPELEMTVQHAPSLSPNKTIQFHTRASRKHDGKKVALYLSPYISGIDQLVIGELLGGLYMIPPGYDFPSTAGPGSEPSDPRPWPKVEGVDVHYLQRHLEMFAKRRRREQYIDGLESKPRHMMTLNQMANVLHIDPNILRQRVYDPLKSAYETRQTRQEFVDLSDILHVRGKIFPVRRMGFYQDKGQEVFCVDKALVPLCEHTLYGRLDQTPAEVLDKNTVRQLLGSTKAETDALWQSLQQAFFKRKNYERNVDVEGVNFSYDSFGFFRREDTATSEFFIFPDALIPAYRRVKGVDLATAENWAEQPSIRQFKTSDWYTADDIMEALDLNLLTESEDALFVEEVFQLLKRQSRKLRPGRDTEVKINIERRKQSLTCSKRWLPMAPENQKTALVVDTAAFQWIKSRLDLDGEYGTRHSFDSAPHMEL